MAHKLNRTNKSLGRRTVCLGCVVGLIGILGGGLAMASTGLAAEDEPDDERFNTFEIRVIRPRYFTKRKRFELGIEGMVITNQTFIYTYLMTGLLTFHLTESLGLELSAAIGTSIDKEDKDVLEDDFNIKTQILRTSTMTEGNVLWTPIYGKYQLASGRVIYFDTYLSAGAGTSGVEYLYDHCVQSDQAGAAPTLPAAQVVQYGTVSFGLGQRFFISKNSSIKWDLRDHIFSSNSADGSCDPGGEVGTDILHQNITMQFGFSRFF